MTLAGCDPGVIARFSIVPVPTPAPGDSAAIVAATQVAGALAARHQMTALPRDRHCQHAGYWIEDVWSDHRFRLTLCVTSARGGVEVRVSEFITAHWGAKGDSLRDEVHDSLVARFGNAAVTVN